MAYLRALIATAVWFIANLRATLIEYDHYAEFLRTMQPWMDEQRHAAYLRDGAPYGDTRDGERRWCEDVAFGRRHICPD